MFGGTWLDKSDLCPGFFCCFTGMWWGDCCTITAPHLLSSPSSSFTFSNLHFSYGSHLTLILISLLFPMTLFVLLYIMNFSIFLCLSLLFNSPTPFFFLFSSNPCAHTVLMSWNILSGGTLSQTYHFNLISIKKIISLRGCLTAANGFLLSWRKLWGLRLTAKKMQSSPPVSPALRRFIKDALRAGKTQDKRTKPIHAEAHPCWFIGFCLLVSLYVIFDIAVQWKWEWGHIQRVFTFSFLYRSS